MKRLFAAVTVTLVMLIAAPLASHASHDDYLYPADAWQVREIGPDLVWHAATESYVENETTLHLIKPTGQTGTSAETTNLGIEGDTVTVDVIFNEESGALPDAGAVRLFAYDHADGDTLTEAPQQVAVATGDGQLTLDTSAFAGPIGTLGMTYDASNDSAGDVIFKNLQVDGETVSFRLHAEPDPTQEPTSEPTVEPTETQEPIAVPTAVPAGLDKPQRGDPIWPWLVGIGTILAAGAALAFNRVTSNR